MTTASRAILPALAARSDDLEFPYVVAAQWSELGEAAVAVGALDACQRFYDALRPYAGTTVVSAAAVGFGGAIDHHLGVLAAALGRHAAAVKHLEAAAVIHERLTAWPWLTSSRTELATVLARRGRPADRERVDSLAAAARAIAAELGMAGVLRRLDAILLPAENVFRRDGDSWRIAYSGREIRLRHTKGLSDLAVLIRAQGAQIPAVELAGAIASGTDPVLDRRAQADYRSRTLAIEEDPDEARRHHDLDHGAKLADEHAFLARELFAAVGLAHRGRGLADDRERARKAVAMRIKDSLNRIAVENPELAAHLGSAVSTGHLCSYRPAETVHWTL